MKYLYKNEPQLLKFIIAGYEEKMVYHEFSEDGNLNAGKPMTEDSLKSVFKVLNSKFVDFDVNFEFNGLIPRNVIKFSTDERKIIWYTPSCIKKLLFQDELPIETGCYPIPNLLWKINQNQLFVYALDSIPKSINSKVYHAPFFNVNGLGSVCMGNAKFVNDSNYYEDIMSLAETAFFNSYFTHSSNNQLLKVNYVEFMNNIKENGILTFDKKQLCNTKKTIKDLF